MPFIPVLWRSIRIQPRAADDPMRLASCDFGERENFAVQVACHNRNDRDEEQEKHLDRYARAAETL